MVVFVKSCTIPNEHCPIEWSYWGYRPSLSTNLAFAVVFGISTIAFLVQGIASKRWLGFTIAMASGCALEVVGYIGRVLAYNDVFSEVCTDCWTHLEVTVLICKP
jgi:hypothetical protein